MNDVDAERFDHIRRSIQYGATIKDLAWLVRLVEKLDKALSSQPSALSQTAKLKAESRELKDSPMKKTVNFFFVEVDDPMSAGGKKWGVQCDVCNQQFFDLVSKGKNPRLIASGIPVAIEHAEVAHQSTGGLVTSKEKLLAKNHRPAAQI